MSEITQEQYQEKLASGEKMIVDFYAEWCGPCKQLAVILDGVSKEQNDVAIYKVNIETADKLTMDLGIRNLPTVLYIKDGEVKHRAAGSVTTARIRENIQQYL